jgi:CRISPR-associated protein Csm2
MAYEKSPNSDRQKNNPPREKIDTHDISFQTISPELFNSVAKRKAVIIAANRGSNKATQVRKFYDEVSMWDMKVSMHPEKFQEYLPYIRMLNAKVAYAKGRNNLVDDNFVDLMNHCLKEVNSVESMHVFKLFMEAFIGFYKLERPKD